MNVPNLHVMPFWMAVTACGEQTTPARQRGQALRNAHGGLLRRGNAPLHITAARRAFYCLDNTLFQVAITGHLDPLPAETQAPAWALTLGGRITTPPRIEQREVLAMAEIIARANPGQLVFLLQSVAVIHHNQTGDAL